MHLQTSGQPIFARSARRWRSKLSPTVAVLSTTFRFGNEPPTFGARPAGAGCLLSQPLHPRVPAGSGAADSKISFVPGRPTMCLAHPSGIRSQ